MKKISWKKGLALCLTIAMLLSLSGMSSLVSAASKAVKISTKKVTLQVGKSKKVTVKNKPAKAKITWSSKNKKVAKVKNGKITAVKTGSTKITCKVVYKTGKKAKKTTKKFNIAVKVVAKTAAKATVPPVATNAPTAVPSKAPVVSNTPAASAQPTQEVKANLYDSNIGEEHTSANGITTKDNGMMRKDLSTLDLMEPMALGWNLGNQMETSDYTHKRTTVRACETSAGNPVAKQKTFSGLKQYGINTVRIPVGWSNLMEDDGTYTINEGLMNRVEEIINYALNEEMYVVVNIHWDGQWWGMFGDPDQAIRDEAWRKYEAIWTQLSARYKEYSDRLIFEGANEELSTRLNDDWRHPEKGQEGKCGTLTEDEIYETANKINQKFVDIVRASGGNNTYRHLLIAGNGNCSCHVAGTVDDRFVMPTDLDENGNSKLSVSVHIYDPETFGITRTPSSGDGYRDSWGQDVYDNDGNLIYSKEADYAAMKSALDQMKKFTEQGYGVIIGECGCAVTNKDGIPDWLKEFFKECLENDFCAVMWDEGSYYNRKDGYFTYDDVGQTFAEATGKTVTLPENAVINNTGIPVPEASKNTNPKVMYTWEGQFMRHVGDTTAQELLPVYNWDVACPGVGRTDSATEGLKWVINDEFWHLHLCPEDWSQFEEPCIRIYPMDDPTKPEETKVSMESQLQLAYAENGEGSESTQWQYERDYDQVDVDGNINEKTNWVGKYIKLDTDHLKKFPWLIITTNTYTGASYVKIEICDGAYNADGTKFEK